VNCRVLSTRKLAWHGAARMGRRCRQGISDDVRETDAIYAREGLAIPACCSEIMNKVLVDNAISAVDLSAAGCSCWRSAEAAMS